MNLQLPKISVVTVCYNAVYTIEKTILSVINQTYPNIEYIIIDGASSDGTVDIINKYLDKITYFVSEPDKGIYDAMNKGIKTATGDWINFMNAGDYFYDKDVIQKIVWQKQDNVEVLFGDIAVLYNGSQYIENARPFYDNLPLHHNMGFNHQATFVLTSLAKMNMFDTFYELAADYNMIITLFRKKAKFQKMDIIVACYNTKGQSNQRRRKHIYETLMVDHPYAMKKNTLLSYLIFAKIIVYSSVKSLLFFFFPDLGSYVMEKFIHKKYSS